MKAKIGWLLVITLTCFHLRLNMVNKFFFAYFALQNFIHTKKENMRFALTSFSDFHFWPKLLEIENVCKLRNVTSWTC